MTGAPDDPRVTGPLAGHSVLVPRAVGQAAVLSARVAALGGRPIEAPVLTIEPGDDDGLRAALHDLEAGAFVAVCFTSPNGVRAVRAALDAVELDRGAFTGTTVAVVGPGTAGALRSELQRDPDLVPERATTASLAAAFPRGGGQVLLPRADIASPVLPDVLRELGYEPVEVIAYRTGRPASLDDAVLEGLERGEIDLLAFGSSSTVRNFAALVGDRPWNAAVVSIGPVTSRTCRALGIEVAAEADPHDLDGLVAALVAAARPMPA